MSVQRVASLSRGEFERRYLARGEPVVVTGAMEGWGALSNWTPGYFAEALGDVEVGVTYNPDGVYASKSAKRMPMRDYVALLESDDPERQKHYLTCDIGNVLPQLGGDYALPPHIDPRMNARLHLFFGRDSVTGNHYHPWQQNTLTQIYGRKQVVMFEPGQFDLLDPEPFSDDRFNFSRLDFDRPDLRARSTVVELSPGEMLFIPVHWWHGVKGPGMCISAAFFWPASIEHYRFPEPGLRCVAKSPRKLAESVRALVRRRL